LSSEKDRQTREDLSGKKNRFNKRRFIREKKIDQTREDLSGKKNRFNKRRFIRKRRSIRQDKIYMIKRSI